MRSANLTDKRCSWASVDAPLLLQYHDGEWGVPVHNDRKHFEVLVLSGAQAGLNWSLVLTNREEFEDFDSYSWRFVGGQPKRNHWKTTRQVPATTPESEAFSKDLKHR